MTTTRRVRRSTRSNGGSVDARATMIQVNRADHSTSNQTTYSDEFDNIAQLGNLILPTPYDLFTMFNLIERSNMLKQCIEAIVVNTVMTGWEIGKISRDIDIDEQERDELQSFIDFANSEQSLSTVMSLAVRDRESVGFGFIEVIRDASGRISLLRHAPAYRTRLSLRNQDEVLVKYDVPRGKRLVVVKEFRKFRRFLQIVNGKITWFKEYGDPRGLNAVTGRFDTDDGYTPDSPATEIYHMKNPSNEYYGTPRWINQLPSIIGSREAEEVNMRYFEDNTVPPMMLTVAGGRLTAASFKNLNDMINNSATTGRERQNKIMLVEAVGEGDSLDGKGTPVTLKVEKMTDARQSDELFKGYDESNQAKVRSSFRIPAVAVGMANEHNFATANVAMFAAETQVFGPLRVLDDEGLNNKLVTGRAGLRLKTCKLVSRTPAITSPEMMMKSLTALNVMGAVTPRGAQLAANQMMQIELNQYPKKDEDGYEDWMDRPMPLTTARGNPDDALDPNSPEYVKPATANTDKMQNQKDPATKALEKGGDVGMKSPENGAQ